MAFIINSGRPYKPVPVHMMLRPESKLPDVGHSMKNFVLTEKDTEKMVDMLVRGEGLEKVRKSRKKMEMIKAGLLKPGDEGYSGKVNDEKGKESVGEAEGKSGKWNESEELASGLKALKTEQDEIRKLEGDEMEVDEDEDKKEEEWEEEKEDGSKSVLEDKKMDSLTKSMIKLGELSPYEGIEKHIIDIEDVRFLQFFVPGESLNKPKHGESFDKSKHSATCACPKHGRSRNEILPRLVLPVSEQRAKILKSLVYIFPNMKSRDTSNMTPQEDAWITKRGYHQLQYLDGEVIERVGDDLDLTNQPYDVSTHHYSRCSRGLLEVLQNQVCHYERLVRRKQIDIAEVYGHVEALILFLKTPDYQRWIQVDGPNDGKKTEQMCLLLAYLFSDFFLRVESSPNLFTKFYKNLGLLLGTMCSLIDGWSEDRCEGLSMKGAKLLRRIQRFAEKEGLELKEIAEKGEIKKWPQYGDDFDYEPSRLEEEGALFGYMAYLRQTWGGIGGIKYHTELVRILMNEEEGSEYEDYFDHGNYL